MKTQAKSYRFDENDLALAMAKSNIQKSQKLMDFLLAEYVRDLKPQYLSLPKDFVEFKNIVAINGDGKKVKITNLSPPKSDYTIDTLGRIAELEKELQTIPDVGLGKSRKKFIEKQIFQLKKEKL